MTQCVHVPFGASGSSQIRAMLLVPLGILVHQIGGEELAPSAVYCFGTALPLVNAVLPILTWAAATAWLLSVIATMPVLAKATRIHNPSRYKVVFKTRIDSLLMRMGP